MSPPVPSPPRPPAVDCTLEVLAPVLLEPPHAASSAVSDAPAPAPATARKRRRELNSCVGGAGVDWGLSRDKALPSSGFAVGCTSLGRPGWMPRGCSCAGIASRRAPRARRREAARRRGERHTGPRARGAARRSARSEMWRKGACERRTRAGSRAAAVGRHGATAVIHRRPGSDTRDVRAARDRLCRLADEDLMALVAATDRDALEAIYDRHCAAGYSLAYRIVGRGRGADDVCQEAFMAVWRSGGRYDPAFGSVRSWLLTIAHHRAIDAIRRAARRQERQVFDERAADLVAADDDTERAAMQRAESHDTWLLLQGLPGEQRQVIELAFYSGFSHTEIADALAVPLGTVKGRMRRGLEKLREQMLGART